MKKKKESREEIELPEKIEANLENGLLKIKGKKGETQRNFFHPKIKLSLEGRKIVVASKEKGKKGKKMVGTYVAHIKNMFKGVEQGHSYKLKICSGHFPMNVKVSGKELVVTNFLGEKVSRRTTIKGDANVKVDGQIITVESPDKEIAGQVAADIEKLTKISNRDLRIFQDGIYIIEKGNKPIR